VSAGRRILIIGGLALALWGMGHGLWYALFAEHQTLDKIGASLASAFVGAARADQTLTDSSLQAYQRAKYVYDRQVDVHSHWIGLAMLLITLAIFFDRLLLSERAKLLLASGTFLGALLFPLGVLLQTISDGPAPRAVAVAGSALEIVCLLAIAISLARPHLTPRS
jgi:hypothetical protein